jgi:formaldehyde-activating enzyme involved in methanogenesis
MDRFSLRGYHMDRFDLIEVTRWTGTFSLLKDAYTQSRKLYENRISSWYGALQQILNNIPKLKQLSRNKYNNQFHFVNIKNI